MTLKTERLILRPFVESDAESVYEYAKDPAVGPIAGWPAHTSVENSREIIRSVLAVPETYAICLKPDGRAIGAAGLMIGKSSNMEIKDSEAEIGYWLGVPFWGRGIMPEAVNELIRHAFCDLCLERLWCGYFEGNDKSRRVQEKCGFTYLRTDKDIYWKPMDDMRTEHITVLEKNDWEKSMNKENIIIRPENKEEYREVENLVRESFWNIYCPGCREHYVLKMLRDDPDFVRELDFVMEKDGKLIGQNIFVRAKISADDGRDIPILTMGPICITPELKRRGYGKKLLDYSLEKAAELGYGAVCFEGNILFYGESGFKYASEFGIRYHGLPEGEDASFFLCKELIPGYLNGITGEYATPEGYFVCEKYPEDFEKYESEFPYKEKLKLPGQIF